tara:strand:+ start:179 stop:472 length:294 start_codon:yes stop_codon:yes gene_type:complete
MNSEQIIIQYFHYKQIQKRGFCKYGVFRRIIEYLLDVHNNPYFIRKTFLKLVEKNYFYRSSPTGKKSYRYRFNQDKYIQYEQRRREEMVFPIIITFD